MADKFLNIIKWSFIPVWIIGVALLGVMIVAAFAVSGGLQATTTNILTGIITLIASVPITGFFRIGQLTKNKFLMWASGLAIILNVTNAILAGIGVFYIFPNSSISAIFSQFFSTASLLSIIVPGIAMLLMGVAVLQLKKRLGTIAKATGVLMIITAALTITIFGIFLTWITAIPAAICQIILFFKAAKKL